MIGRRQTQTIVCCIQPLISVYRKMTGRSKADQEPFLIVRGPCPMMNTLANHGYINHDGRNITAEGLVNGLVNGLNFDPTLAAGLFAQVIVANPEPNATYFTLEQIREHDVLEHDASLSRADAYFGNNYSFNESVFAESTSFWSGDVLDANALAMSKVGRQVSSKAHNPTYRWTASVENAGVFEVGGIIIALGDLATSTVERSYVEYFFRESWEKENLESKVSCWKKLIRTA